MILVNNLINEGSISKKEVRLITDRYKLQKRRWRGKAEDGVDFAFEMSETIHHGSVFYQTESHLYRICQLSEKVITIKLDCSSNEAANIGWQIGNLHMPMEVTESQIRVVDDPAVRNLFQNMGIDYQLKSEIFQPIKGAIGIGHSHDHNMGHDHEHSH
tara:strand:- start:313 stop:786 length:474 start_codon:yes stop_codon:yes gene_type:complete